MAMSHVLVVGLVNGMIYGLFAIGLSLLFGVARIISVVHGSFFLLGAYGTFALVVWANGPQVPFLVGVLLTLAACGLIAFAIHMLAVRPLIDSPIAVLLVTFGLAIGLQEVVRLTFGARPRSVPSLAAGSVEVLGLGVHVQSSRMVALAVSVVLLAALSLMMARTTAGKSIRAVAQDAEAATLMGIRSTRVLALVFVVGSVLAAVAGILAGSFLPVTPVMWLGPLVKAFAIVVLGGLGSLGGTIIAALALSYSEALVQFYVSPQVSEIVPLLIIILILLVRPYGMFGQPEHA